MIRLGVLLVMLGLAFAPAHEQGGKSAWRAFFISEESNLLYEVQNGELVRTLALPAEEDYLPLEAWDVVISPTGRYAAYMLYRLPDEQGAWAYRYRVFDLQSETLLIDYAGQSRHTYGGLSGFQMRGNSINETTMQAAIGVIGDVPNVSAPETYYGSPLLPVEFLIFDLERGNRRPPERYSYTDIPELWLPLFTEDGETPGYLPVVDILTPENLFYSLASEAGEGGTSSTYLLPLDSREIRRWPGLFPDWSPSIYDPVLGEILFGGSSVTIFISSFPGIPFFIGIVPDDETTTTEVIYVQNAERYLYTTLPASYRLGPLAGISIDPAPSILRERDSSMPPTDGSDLVGEYTLPFPGLGGVFGTQDGFIYAHREASGWVVYAVNTRTNTTTATPLPEVGESVFSLYPIWLGD